MIHIWLLLLSVNITQLVSCVAYDVQRKKPIDSRDRKRTSITTYDAWKKFDFPNNTEKLSALIGTVRIRTSKPIQPGPLSFMINTPDPDHVLPKGTGATIFIKGKNLFTKRKEERLIPLQKQFIAQGVVNRSEKKITFMIPQKIVSLVEFYVIMSFPKKYERDVEKYTISHIAS